MKVRAARLVQSRVDAMLVQTKFHWQRGTRRFNAAEPGFPELLPQCVTTVACD
jgi:hypothetical protein